MIDRLHIFIIFLSLIYTFTISDAVGENGMVVSSKYDASQIGVDVLKNGGNAIDAAIAVGFALAVTHPSAGNIGGGGFMMIRFSDGTVTSIDFRETAPAKSTTNMFLDEKGEVIPGLSWSSALATGVPGTVAGFGYAHKKYGTMKWSDLINPSILLAKYGFKLDYFNTVILNSDKYKSYLSLNEESKKNFVKDSNYKLNEVLIQTDLSNTLSRISKYGYKEFYLGETSTNIIKTMRENNGIITYNDLVSYKPTEREPITFTYRNNKIYSMPPPSSGGITLAQILNQLEYLDLSQLGHKSSNYIHYFVESEKRAYADRAKYLGDTDFIDVPIDYLISKEYSKQNFESIDPYHSTPSKSLNEDLFINLHEEEETTHYSIVDKFGNAVSVTYTINGWFGNGITVNNSGFLLNNEMDDFVSKPGHPNAYGLIGNSSNSIQPFKRMLSSMTPTIVEDENNKLSLILGSPGGSTIITTVAQIIVNIIDFNMSIENAIENKRFHHQWMPEYIQLEKHSISQDVINELLFKGHDVMYRSSFGIGEANCIQIKDDIYFGSGDSRRGAHAIGY